MNKEDNIISLSSIITPKEDDIEVLDESDFTPIVNPNDDKIDVIEDITDNNIIEEKKERKKIDDKIIGRIQIGLILFLIVSASLIYFFGYDLFEPFIKVD